MTYPPSSAPHCPILNCYIVDGFCPVVSGQEALGSPVHNLRGRQRSSTLCSWCEVIGVPVTFDCCPLFPCWAPSSLVPAHPLFFCTFDLWVVTVPADTNSRWPCYCFPRLKRLLAEVSPSANNLALNSLTLDCSLLLLGHSWTDLPAHCTGATAPLPGPCSGLHLF